MTSGAPIGRYLLRERIARGGMGEVFRAAAIGPSGFEKPVIVKRIRPEHAGRGTYVELFVEEAKRMTLLAHPNIVQVLDFGLGDAGDYFLVLELVDGVDLARLAKSYARRREPVPIPIALAVIQGVLRGLHHAHTQRFPDGEGLVHRDVSPGNVLLSKVGEVKVADFGVARVAVRNEEGGRQGLVGKLLYMPPEQFEERDVDARADLFAAGVTLFELVAGALPFDRKSVATYRNAAKEGHFTLLSAARPDAPRALVDVVATAIAPDPNDRFESARAMAKAIEAIGQAASADDLAEVVARAAAEDGDKPKRVVRLGAPPPDEGELTRATTGGRVIFTVKLTGAASEPSAVETRPDAALGSPPRAVEATPAAAAPRARRWPAIVVGVGLAAAAMFGAARFARSSFDKQAGASSSPSSSPGSPSSLAVGRADSTASASASAAGEGATPDDAEAAGSSAAPLPNGRAASTWRRRAPAPSAIGVPRSSASSALPASASDCHGKVSIFAASGWVVSGGPSVVQAPGRYDWRCGSFRLHAVSRADPKLVRDGGVTIRAGADAVFDLR